MREWAIQRARFSHDRLKNQFLQSVVRVIRALQGHTVDDEFVEKFLQRLPTLWDELNMEAMALLRRAEFEAGPHAWFHVYPLNRLEQADRSWMEALVTAAWRARREIAVEVDHVRIVLTEISTICQEMRDSWLGMIGTHGEAGSEGPKREDGGTSSSLLDAAVLLHFRCQDLCDAFYKFRPESAIRVLGTLRGSRCG